MIIVESYITSTKYKIKCPYRMKPKGIVIHNTYNDASAQNEVNYMKNNNNKVSFHVAIDDKEVIIAIPFDRNSWSCGDGINGEGNRNYINIEICYSKSGGAKFKKAEENTVKYVAKLMKEYGFTINNIKRHRDFSGKNCPHRTNWTNFLDRLKQEINQESSFLVKINCDVLNVRQKPTTDSKIVTKVKRNEVYTIVEKNGNWGKLKSGVGYICLDYTIRK